MINLESAQALDHKIAYDFLLSNFGFVLNKPSFRYLVRFDSLWGLMEVVRRIS